MLFSDIILEIKKNAILFLLILLILLSIPVFLSSLNQPFNVIGIVKYNKTGIQISGFIFNYYGKGVKTQINIIVNSSRIFTLTNDNGNFTILLNSTFLTSENITLLIRHLFYTEKITLDKYNSTFAYASNKILGYYISKTLSIVTVYHKSVIAVYPKNTISINGEKYSRQGIFEVTSNSSVYPKESYFGYSRIYQENKIYSIGIIVSSIIGLEILSYFSLSQFPRKELDELMRLIGIKTVYFSKFTSILLFGIFLFLIPILFYNYLENLPLNFFVVQSIFSALSFSFGIVGIYSFLDSKESILASIVLSDYILDLVYFNLGILSVLSFILLISGYLKIKLRYS
ncbi:hypothetical protein B6F84_03940 [Acidianus manzaensis]|uniref:Uncharacterized protein n=2 Tax=Acidianus manzaensis TaxID=282676 RepID=A0A1W6JYC3_9CREN|nr:hypothetical protein B6F84_03940 [Acidianus manzaensis]